MCPAKASSQGEAPDQFLTIRLNPVAYAELKRLAKDNERSMGAEARLAIRAYLKAAA